MACLVSSTKTFNDARDDDDDDDDDERWS